MKDIIIFLLGLAGCYAIGCAFFFGGFIYARRNPELKTVDEVIQKVLDES